MTKTQEEPKKKKLDNVEGGKFDPTWLPVDENCPEFNAGNKCFFSTMKGHYNNCCDCKHFNR